MKLESLYQESVQQLKRVGSAAEKTVKKAGDTIVFFSVERVYTLINFIRSSFLSLGLILVIALLLLKMAQIYNTSLGDPSKAKGYYLQALDIQPKATEPLSEIIAIYFADERWTETEILLDILILQ